VSMGKESEKRKIGVYGMVPIAILQDESVTKNMLKVYTALASFQGGGDSCWPSVAKIAERAGVRNNAVSEATDKLEEAGWIQKTRRSNQRQTNKYEVLVDVEQEEGIPYSGKSGNPENPENARIPENPENPLYEKNKEKNNQASPSSHKQVIEEYAKLHEEATGDKPTINGKQGMAIKRLLKEHSKENVLAKLRRYYKIDTWFTRGGRDISMFEAHYDKIELPKRNQESKPKINVHELAGGYYD